MDVFLQQIVVGLTIGSLYALIAVGYTVVYGIVQLINFAHGEVFMIGAFGALATWTVLFKGETAIWILPIMIVGAACARWALPCSWSASPTAPLPRTPTGAPHHRHWHLRPPPGGGAALLRTGPRFPRRQEFAVLPGIDIVTGQPFSVSGINVGRPTLFIIGCLIVCSVALWSSSTAPSRVGPCSRCRRTPTRHASWVSTSTGPSPSPSRSAPSSPPSPVSPRGCRRTIAFNMGFMSGLKAFTAAVLGGIGNIQGAVAGGLVLGIIEAQATQFLGGATWANVWAFILPHHRPGVPTPGPPRRKGGRPRMSTVTSTPEETTDERSPSPRLLMPDPRSWPEPC